MAHSPACLYAPSNPDRQWKLEATVPADLVCRLATHSYANDGFDFFSSTFCWRDDYTASIGRKSCQWNGNVGFRLIGYDFVLSAKLLIME